MPSERIYVTGLFKNEREGGPKLQANLNAESVKRLKEALAKWPDGKIAIWAAREVVEGKPPYSLVIEEPYKKAAPKPAASDDDGMPF